MPNRFSKAKVGEFFVLKACVGAAYGFREEGIEVV